MSQFWYSRKNFDRTSKNVMSLFNAIDQDIDAAIAAISDIDKRLTTAESKTIYKNCSVIKD